MFFGNNKRDVTCVFVSKIRKCIQSFSSATQAPEISLIIFQGCYTSNGMTFSLGTWHDHSFEQRGYLYHAIPFGGILTRIIHLFMLLFFVHASIQFVNGVLTIDHDLDHVVRLKILWWTKQNKIQSSCCCCEVFFNFIKKYLSMWFIKRKLI